MNTYTVETSKFRKVQDSNPIQRNQLYIYRLAMNNPKTVLKE